MNLIPSNTVQRRLPLRPSEKMSWAPLWGQMCLLEDEVILAYGEDIKHCFHIFALGPSWRGYFVISKKASGTCFKDGNKTPSRPRVKSAPMGWSNIVDFVQSSLENWEPLLAKWCAWASLHRCWSSAHPGTITASTWTTLMASKSSPQMRWDPMRDDLVINSCS